MYNLCRNGRCINTRGGFTCQCTEGYKLSFDGQNCEDIDECREGKVCPPPGLCENSYGSFICTCPDGFKVRKDIKIAFLFDKKILGFSLVQTTGSALT